MRKRTLLPGVNRRSLVHQGWLITLLLWFERCDVCIAELGPRGKITFVNGCEKSS